MKKFLLNFACVTSFLFFSEPALNAEPVCTTIPYFEIGFGSFPFPAPHFGAGFRSQNNTNRRK